MSAMLDFLKIILDCCVTLQQHLMTFKPKLERKNACLTGLDINQVMVKIKIEDYIAFCDKQ